MRIGADWKIKAILSKSLLHNESLKVETSGMNHLLFETSLGFCLKVQNKEQISGALSIGVNAAHLHARSQVCCFHSAALAQEHGHHKRSDQTETV